MAPTLLQKQGDTGTIFPHDDAPKGRRIELKILIAELTHFIIPPRAAAAFYTL